MFSINFKCILLYYGCETLNSIKWILKDIYDDYKPLAKKVYKVIKKHFMIINIQRSPDDPLSIRFR